MPAVSPAMSMGPGGVAGPRRPRAICLRQARCRATVLAVCSARLCHKCERSATWIAPGPVAGALGVGAGRAARRWLGRWQCRPGRWRRRGRGAARRHRRRPRPAPRRPQDRAGRGPAAAAGTCPRKSRSWSGRPPTLRPSSCSAATLRASGGGRSRAGTSWPTTTGRPPRAGAGRGQADGCHHLRHRQQPRPHAVPSRLRPRRHPHRSSRRLSPHRFLSPARQRSEQGSERASPKEGG
jgi:hypothetical protein